MSTNGQHGAREVAVASGKGGTGKTTVVVALALMSAPLVLADADVEAANLELVFPGQREVEESFFGFPRAAIEPTRCTECGLCSELCRFGAVVCSPPYIDTVLCEGCGVCIDYCPAQAIKEVPVQAGTLFVTRTALGPLVSAELRPGQDLSGRLTTQVRQRAREQAERYGYDLVLVDGPPGTGCPAIATITGVDKLIAVTEPTAAGVRDLERLIDLASRFQLVPEVVINKYDISLEGASLLEQECKRRDVPIVARIPFIEGLAQWLSWGAPPAEMPVGLDPLRETAEKLRK